MPIYDARGVEVTDFGKIIKHMKKLPLYDDDIPEGGYAVPGFTVKADSPRKGTNEPPQISYNIQWVILLSIPRNRAPHN